MNDLIYDRIAQSKGYTDAKDMLVDLYQTKGVSQGVIAALIGCSLPTVKTLREHYGIGAKPKKPSLSTTIPEKELRKKSCIELAKKYKLSKSYVWRLKRELKAIGPTPAILDEEV
jgi:transposase